MAIAIDGFSESVFTDVGTTLFTQDNYLKIKIDRFAYSGTVGTIDTTRVDQEDVKVYKDILSGSRFIDENVNGYRIDTRVDAYEYASTFDIEEVGLYAKDPQNGDQEVLVWVGKLANPIRYNPKIEVTISVYIPLTNGDIKVDLYTNPKRVSDHNLDINSHEELRLLAENSKLMGIDRSSEENQIILTNPAWVGQKVFYEYIEPKAYLFIAKHTNTGAVTFREEGKYNHPLRLKGNDLMGGEVEAGKPYYAIYQALPDPHFELVGLGQDIIKRTVWRIKVDSDGQTEFVTRDINPNQDMNLVVINVDGIEIINLVDWSLGTDKVVTTWDSLKKDQWIKVEAFKIGQTQTPKWGVWRFQITEDGQTDLPVVGIDEEQPINDISLNIEGLEVIDLSEFTLGVDKITTTWDSLKKDQWVKVEAFKKIDAPDNNNDESSDDNSSTLDAYSTDPFGDGSLKDLLPLDGNLEDLVTGVDATSMGVYDFTTAVKNEGIVLSSGHERNGFSFVDPIIEDQPFSIALWFKGSSINIGTLGLSDFNTGGGYGFGYNGGASLSSSNIEDVSNGAYDTSIFALYTGKEAGRGIEFAVDTNNFIHVVGIYTGTELQVYLNGTLVGTADHSDGWATTFDQFTSYNDSYNDDYVYCTDGIIDHLQVFDRALTAEEVEELYNS